MQDLIEQLWHCALIGCALAFVVATASLQPVRLITSSLLPRLLLVGVPAYLGINYLLYQDTLLIGSAGTSFASCLYWLRGWWLPRHGSGGEIRSSIYGDDDRPDRALGSVVVDGGAAVIEEECEDRLPIEGIAHGLGQVALAGNAQKLCFAPDSELVDPRPAMVLTNLPAHPGGLPGSIPIDVLGGADPIESLLGNRRAGASALEATGTAPAGCLTVAAITHVSTLARVAQILGEDEDWLNDISVEMNPEDGIISVYGPGEDYTPAFTDLGIENLRQIVETHKENAQHTAATKHGKAQ